MSCLHLFAGGVCRYCGEPSPYARRKRPRVALPGEARLEKDEQKAIESLYRQIGGKVYTIGTVRQHVCRHCRRPTGDHSTRQTPGIADIYVVLPVKPSRGPFLRPVFLWHEVKRDILGPNSRRTWEDLLSDEQKEFRDLVTQRSHAYVVGPESEAERFLLRHKFLL